MIYLDNSATTKPDELVLRVMQRCYTEVWGNPSSPHRMGVDAEKMLRTARKQVAGSMGAAAEEIIFTSGGTEANNLALKGLLARWPQAKKPAQIVISSVEHPSVIEPARQLEAEGWRLAFVPVDRNGRILLDELDQLLRHRTALVSLMMVNNEVGTIQPIRQAAELILERQPEAWLHVDAVQAYGKIPLDVRQLGVDSLTVSGHKVHAPKGVGALYVREGLAVQELIAGGGQESGRRSGTENVAGAAGLGQAAVWIEEHVQNDGEQMWMLRKSLWEGIREAIPQAVLNGDDSRERAAPHILNCSFPGVPGEVMVHALEMRGIYASMASACSTKKSSRSHVLTAMYGREHPNIDSAVRFSLSRFTTREEISQAVIGIREAYRELTNLR